MNKLYTIERRYLNSLRNQKFQLQKVKFVYSQEKDFFSIIMFSKVSFILDKYRKKLFKFLHRGERNFVHFWEKNCSAIVSGNKYYRLNFWNSFRGGGGGGQHFIIFHKKVFSRLFLPSLKILRSMNMKKISIFIFFNISTFFKNLTFDKYEKKKMVNFVFDISTFLKNLTFDKYDKRVVNFRDYFYIFCKSYVGQIWKGNCSNSFVEIVFYTLYSFVIALPRDNSVNSPRKSSSRRLVVARSDEEETRNASSDLVEVATVVWYERRNRVSKAEERRSFAAILLPRGLVSRDIALYRDTKSFQVPDHAARSIIIHYQQLEELAVYVRSLSVCVRLSRDNPPIF